MSNEEQFIEEEFIPNANTKALDMENQPIEKVFRNASFLLKALKAYAVKNRQDFTMASNILQAEKIVNAEYEKIKPNTPPSSTTP